MAWNSEYLRRRHAERKAWATDLLGGECCRCGSTERMEFDHVDPATKTANIGDVLGRWSIAHLLEELDKCQLLCRPCHEEKSLTEQGGPAEHGTLARYTHHKCRCVLCVEANRAYTREAMRRYRAKKKLEGM